MKLATLQSGPRQVPLLLKLALSAFVAGFVPAYWQVYGPANFLYLCDIALFVTLAAVWLEAPLLASAALVGALIPQAIWIIDFVAELVGIGGFGTTAYMFSDQTPWSIRFFSAFHAWLPFLLVWLVWRLGYDPRAFWVWTVPAWVVLVISYFASPGRNINFVYGLGGEPQQWLHPDLYFVLVLAGAPLLVFYPAHRLLQWTMPARR